MYPSIDDLAHAPPCPAQFLLPCCACLPHSLYWLYVPFNQPTPFYRRFPASALSLSSSPLPNCSLNAQVPWVSALGHPWLISPMPGASTASGMLIICSSYFHPSYLLTSKLQLPSREFHLDVLLAWLSTCAFSQWVSQKMPHVWRFGVRAPLHVADSGWHQWHNCRP